MSYAAREVKNDMFTHYLVEANHHYGARAGVHPGLEIYYHVRGALGLTDGFDRSLAIRPQTALALNSSLGHGEELHGGHVEYRTLVFNSALLEILGDELGVNLASTQFLNPSLTFSPTEVALLDLIRNVSDAMLAESLALSLLSATLLRTENTYSPRLRRLAAVAKYPSAMGRVRSVIHQNLFNPEFSLRDLSRAANISPFHLVRSFKARSGLSPFAYRNRLRIQYVRAELRAGKTLKSLTETLGFSSPEVLSRSFKQLLGTSPRQMKKTADVAEKIHGWVTRPSQHAV